MQFTIKTDAFHSGRINFDDTREIVDVDDRTTAIFLNESDLMFGWINQLTIRFFDIDLMSEESNMSSMTSFENKRRY